MVGEEKAREDVVDYLTVQITELLGGSQVLGSWTESSLAAHEALARGLPSRSLIALIRNLAVIDFDNASKAIGMSLRTYQRHKDAPAKSLSVAQSGRAWKFAEILAKATRVFGSQEEAEQWL